MAASIITENRFERVLEAGLRRASLRRAPILVSFTRPMATIDPLAAFAGAHVVARERAYWEHPESGLAFTGIGIAHSIIGTGTGRFDEVRKAWQALLADAVIEGADGAWGRGPLLLGGFSFDPLRPGESTWASFPDALLTLPRCLISRVQGNLSLTLNTVVQGSDSLEAVLAGATAGVAELLGRLGYEEQAQRDRAHWKARDQQLLSEDVLPAEQWKTAIADASTALQHGTFEKVVLARQANVRSASHFEPARILARLRQSYPGSYLFAVEQPGLTAGAPASCLVGASPERLVRLEHGVVQVTCLAGSSARGVTPEEDQLLGKRLLASVKDRTEHAVVAQMLREALDTICADLHVPETPEILRLRNVQHLYTPISGHLAEHDGVGGATVPTLLDLVARLHPTPAVGGYPREAALAYIRDHEQLDRGWYAGPVGWLDQHGEGEFAVAIRSALLRESGDVDKPGEALLFAGCGIMGDSNPEAEYEESSLKMRAMLAALSDQ